MIALGQVCEMRVTEVALCVLSVGCIWASIQGAAWRVTTDGSSDTHVRVLAGLDAVRLKALAPLVPGKNERVLMATDEPWPVVCEGGSAPCLRCNDGAHGAWYGVCTALAAALISAWVSLRERAGRNVGIASASTASASLCWALWTFHRSCPREALGLVARRELPEPVMGAGVLLVAVAAAAQAAVAVVRAARPENTPAHVHKFSRGGLPLRGAGQLRTRMMAGDPFEEGAVKPEPATTVVPPKVARRGVSMDEDGKSNTWALEPKMQVAEKGEGTSPLIAGGAAVGILGLLAVILSNLPDPDSF